MQHLIEFLIVYLVKNPEEVKVERREENDEVIYDIYAHPDDIGRIIGQHGRTIKAIRSIAKIVAIPKKERFRLEIVD